MMIQAFIRAANCNYQGNPIKTLGRKLKFLFTAVAHLKDYRQFAERMGALADFNQRLLPPRLVGLLEWPYINCAWDVRKRLDAVAEHYEILAKSRCNLRQVNENRQICLADLGFAVPEARIIVDHPPWFIREGEMVLNLFEGELRVASLAFALGSMNGDRTIYVGAIQGLHSGISSEQSLAIFKRLTKGFEGIRPRSLLIEILRMLALQLQINTIHAVADMNRHHRHPYFGDRAHEKLKTDYDPIWEEHEGSLFGSSGFYRLPVVPTRKTLEEIPSKKRAMYRRRHELLNGIATLVEQGLWPCNTADADSIGVVVIGRNEGERLRRCLESVIGQAQAVVYVDSGSADGSVALARSLGVDVVELDMSMPFTAARARNAGFSALTTRRPDIAFVQFVDGDCELMADWLSKAHAVLAQRQEAAAIAGRIRERMPERSIYNRLGEMEWNFQGVGDVGSVGGIFMIRRSAFESVNGFDPSVPAGEEPELCQRLTRAGWIINRSGLDMAWHDLAMTRFGQWWQRQIRGGYGGLDVARRFGLSRFARHVTRARFWSAWPFLVVSAWFGAEDMAGRDAAWFTALAIFALWPVQTARIAIRTWRQGQTVSIAAAYAVLTMISFWPQMVGQLQYLFDKARKRRIRLIEYKSAATCLETRPVEEHPADGRP